MILKIISTLISIALFPLKFLYNLVIEESSSGPKYHLTVDRHIKKDKKGMYVCNNWFGNEVWKPSNVIAATCLDDLVNAVKLANEKGTTIRAVGAMHSWSRTLAVDGGIMVTTDKMNKILNVDLEKRVIEVECGIRLRHLYEFMIKKDLAFPSLPNVDLLTVGGVLANAAHGSTFHSGTMCSLVLEMTVVLPSGEVKTLRRCAQKGTKEHAYFDAILVSMGNLGLIYSVKLQALPTFNVVKYPSIKLYSKFRNNIQKVLSSHETICALVNPTTKINFLLIQVPISPLVSSSSVRNPSSDWKIELLMYNIRPGKKNPFKLFLSNMVAYLMYDYSTDLSRSISEVQMNTWVDGELLIKNYKDRSFLNTEFAVPLENVQDAWYAIEALYEKYREKGYKRIAPVAMRTVGADDRGYLSPTKGRKSVFFDLPHQQVDKIEFEFMKEVEQTLLTYGGRPTWSRKFHLNGEEFLRNYPDAGKYIEVMKELDPKNIFRNSFRERVFGF